MTMKAEGVASEGDGAARQGARVEAEADREAGAEAGVGSGQDPGQMETTHGTEGGKKTAAPRGTGTGTVLAEEKGNGMLGVGMQTTTLTAARGETETADATTLERGAVAVMLRGTVAAIHRVIGTETVTETGTVTLPGKGSGAAMAGVKGSAVVRLPAIGILDVAPRATGITMGAMIRESGTVQGMIGTEGEVGIETLSTTRETAGPTKRLMEGVTEVLRCLPTT